MSKTTDKENKGNFFDQYKKKDSNVNSNVNDSVNNGVNPPVKFNVDPLEQLQEELPNKALTTKLKGIHFDSEVADMIDEQSTSLGRGGKSRLVNDIVKSYFQQKGLL